MNRKQFVKMTRMQTAIYIDGLVFEKPKPRPLWTLMLLMHGVLEARES